MGSDQGLRSVRAYADFKAYENVAQAMGGSMSNYGRAGRTAFVTGAQFGDRARACTWPSDCSPPCTSAIAPEKGIRRSRE